ncbi:MAG: UvrD-helicase domain-containing protein, partial [Bacteroidota bacterium]
MTETFKALDVPLAPGITLVEASAGTGKTYALTELVLRLVLEEGALGTGTPDLRKLLVVTFTNAATEELKTRIRRALREALDAFEGGGASGVVEPFVARYGATREAREAGARRLRHALGQVGEAAVFTIHGFCKRVLERSAFESGEPFAFEFTEDADRLTTRVARDVWHGLVGGHADLGPLALAAGWTLDRLTAHANHAMQFVDTRILPEAAPLADAIGAVRDARQRLRDAWHPAAQEDVVDPRLWRMDKKNKPFTTDLRGAFERVGAFARGDWSELSAVQLCAVDAVSAAIKDGSKAGKEAVADIARDPGFVACSEVLEAIDALEIALVHAFVEDLGRGTRRAKAAASLLTFDDLIERLDRALAHPATGPALRRAIQDQFAVALIDEFQDTDPTQYRIFRRAFGGGRGTGEEGRGEAPLAPEASGDSATGHSPL